MFRRLLFPFFIIVSLLCFSTLVFAATSDWQLFTGPTVKVQAVIKPYINININAPIDLQNKTQSEGPIVIFDCNQGPGTYQSLYPLTFNIISNTPFQLQFEASDLIEQNTNDIIAPEKLAFRFNDPEKTINNFSPFVEGEKKIVYETSIGGVSFSTICDFQLDISYKDKAGTYEGAIFIEVLYLP